MPASIAPAPAASRRWTPRRTTRTRRPSRSRSIGNCPSRRTWPGALARLPVAQRAAVELKALGYSLTEIAEAVGVTPNHAGVLVHRGRLALADHLTPFLDAPP